MYLTQDVIRDDFATIIKQLKISQILQREPEMVMKPAEISRRLKHMPNLYHPLDKGTFVRLVAAKKNEPRNYWYNQIGHVFRLYDCSYSLEGMGMVDNSSGCHTMNTDNNGLVFEIVALPIDTMKRGQYDYK